MVEISADADGIRITFESPSAALWAAMRSMCVFEVSAQAIAARDVLAEGGSWEAAAMAAEVVPLKWGEGRIAPGGGGPWMVTADGIAEIGATWVSVAADGSTLSVVGAGREGYCGDERLELHLRAIVGDDDAAIAAAIRGYVAANEERWIARIAVLSGGAPMPPWAETQGAGHRDVAACERMVAYLAAPQGPVEQLIAGMEAMASSNGLIGLLPGMEQASKAAREAVAAWCRQCWEFSPSSTTWAELHKRQRHACEAEAIRRVTVTSEWRRRIDAAEEMAIGRVVADLQRCHAAGHRADQALSGVMPGSFQDKQRNAAKPRPVDDGPRGGVYGRAKLGLGVVFHTVADFHFQYGSVGGHWWEVTRQNTAPWGKVHRVV